jgi:(p)ppGpp synthase/HD superfamily hydrolase
MRSLWRVVGALVFAAWAHRGQRDKAGRRYIHHLVRVAWLAYGLTGDTETAVLGLLHDYLEDAAPRDGLRRLQLRFGLVTAMRVELLTRPRWTEYGDYIDDLAASNSPSTLAVKIADLLHNTQPGRLLALADAAEERQRLDHLMHYQAALAQLTQRRTILGVRLGTRQEPRR